MTGRRTTPHEEAEIVERYVAGAAIEALIASCGRSKGTIRRILRDADVTRPRGYEKGREWSPEWRAAQQAGTRTPENRERARKALLERLPSMRGPAVNTPIELRLHDALKAAGISFSTQEALLDRYLVDILLRQSPVIIEADGAQHALRMQKAKDAQRDTALTAAGYRVFRFTGVEINRDAGDCIRHVIEACDLAPDIDPVYEIRTSFGGYKRARQIKIKSDPA